jgi:serine/threonine-protein kinase
MELEVLGDRYELQDPIGRGGMATIYRAIDLRMGRTVAVKILREVYSTDPKFVTRFQREARAASSLQHPNIVQVFDYGQSGDSYFIVMEFVLGADLRRYIKKHGTLSNERTIEIAHDVALGLGAAHKRGIVHRDVKPQNVMVNDDGLVKLTDFGIASMYKDAEAERLTTTGMTLGTVQYYAPEQAQGEVVSPAADIYALGIVMYEMVTGRTPFDGDTPVAVAMRHIQDLPEPPSNLNPRVSQGLERIILRCLEKDPRDRYRDGDALAYALENLARSSGRRGASGNVPASRSQFAPFSLPSNDVRPSPNSNPGAFGASGIGSGPRGSWAGGPEGSRVSPSAVRMSDAPGFEPVPNGYGPEGSISTRPYGPAPGTIPRTPGTGRVSHPWNVPDQSNGRRGNGPLVGVIVAAAVLLLGLTCFLLAQVTGVGAGLGSVFNPTPTATSVPTTTVPSFIGKQYNDALTLAQQYHLQLQQKSAASDKPVNTVIDQDPPANTSEPWDFTVTVTVSGGPNKIAVPDVTNKLYAEALGILQQDGFKNIMPPIFQVTSAVPPGYVFKTDPPASTKILPTDPIKLYVSVSPTPTPTNTPPPPTPTNTPTQPTPTPTCTPPNPPTC